MGSVTYLLDTCTFIWLCSRPDMLAERARSVIEDTAVDLALSDASVLEIALKWTAGKIELPEPPRHWVGAQAQAWGITAWALTRDDIYRATELPDHHRDPFDRLLVAAALNHEAPIITPDASVHAYPVSCCW